MKTYIGTKIVQAEPAKRYWLEDGEKIVAAGNEKMAAEMLSVATACEDGYKVIYKAVKETKKTSASADKTE